MKKTILSFLSSLKLTIALLIIIAGASILGTIIPQQYAQGQSPSHLGPGLTKVFQHLQLFDMYHSIWFIILMVLLSLNLIVCSLNRFPASWKLFSTIPSPDRSKPFDDISPDRVLLIEKKQDNVTDMVENIFMRRYKRFKRKDTNNGSFFYGEKGAYSHFGVYLIHASVLIVIAGAIIGSLLGFDAFVNIAEGGSADTVYLGRGKGMKKLGFTVRCDSFSIAFYDNGMPREYRSSLSFIKNNEVMYHGPLLVNHPITFNGIRFYQASYGTVPGDQIYLTIRKGDEKGTSVKVKLNEPLRLRDKHATFEIVRIEDNFMSMGPAVLVNIQSPEETARFWVFKNIEKMRERIPGLLQKVPKFNPGLFKPYYFKLDKIEGKYYTGLQVGYDPGVSIVAIGSIFIVLGFFITFFSSHKRLWVRVEGQEEKSRLSIAAISTRDPVGLKRETDYLIRHFSSS